MPMLTPYNLREDTDEDRFFSPLARRPRVIYTEVVVGSKMFKSTQGYVPRAAYAGVVVGSAISRTP